MMRQTLRIMSIVAGVTGITCLCGCVVISKQDLSSKYEVVFPIEDGIYKISRTASEVTNSHGISVKREDGRYVTEQIGPNSQNWFKVLRPKAITDFYIVEYASKDLKPEYRYSLIRVSEAGDQVSCYLVQEPAFKVSADDFEAYATLRDNGDIVLLDPLMTESLLEKIISRRIGLKFDSFWQRQ